MKHVSLNREALSVRASGELNRRARVATCSCGFRCTARCRHSTPASPVRQRGHHTSHPDRPARELFTAEVISADLERLVALQQEDGGWIVDYLQISPAGSLDWRGYVTVRAIEILDRNATAGP